MGKLIQLTEKQFEDIMREVTDSYFSHYEIYNYNNKHKITKKVDKYVKIKPNNSYDRLTINEGLIKTYPTNVSINYVYMPLKDYDIEISTPQEVQNDDSIVNHIIVKTFVQQVNLKFELELIKSFKTCGYALGASDIITNDSGLKVKIYQFEPKYQNTINNNLGEYIYII